MLLPHGAELVHFLLEDWLQRVGLVGRQLQPRLDLGEMLCPCNALLFDLLPLAELFRGEHGSDLLLVLLMNRLHLAKHARGVRSMRGSSRAELLHLLLDDRAEFLGLLGRHLQSRGELSKAGRGLPSPSFRGGRRLGKRRRSSQQHWHRGQGPDYEDCRRLPAHVHSPSRGRAALSLAQRDDHVPRLWPWSTYRCASTI